MIFVKYTQAAHANKMITMQLHATIRFLCADRSISGNMICGTCSQAFADSFCSSASAASMFAYFSNIDIGTLASDTFSLMFSWAITNLSFFASSSHSTTAASAGGSLSGAGLGGSGSGSSSAYSCCASFCSGSTYSSSNYCSSSCSCSAYSTFFCSGSAYALQHTLQYQRFPSPSAYPSVSAQEAKQPWHSMYAIEAVWLFHVISVDIFGCFTTNSCRLAMIMRHLNFWLVGATSWHSNELS